MGWLQDILDSARRIKARECGSTLPDNPTLADLRREAFYIAQLAKEDQNMNKRYSDEQWRKLSKAIERLEEPFKKGPS